MSAIRRWNSQAALRRRVAMALQRARLTRMKDIMRTVCVWYFVEWRGYVGDAALVSNTALTWTEVDDVMYALLTWANRVYHLPRTLPPAVARSVAWT